VGAGAVGMSFVDTLIHETDATAIIVDRHHAPDGHWSDAYPFVRLHQPSSFYGVNSRPLGQNALDTDPLNAGMTERASSTEILAYCEQVMQALLATGRVRYFPSCEFIGGDQSHDHPHYRFQRIESERIVLDQGSLPAEPDWVYGDCSACGITRRSPEQVFQGETIVPQMVRTFQPAFSTAFIAHVESTMNE
jgi:hypothetical protein